MEFVNKVKGIYVEKRTDVSNYMSLTKNSGLWLHGIQQS